MTETWVDLGSEKTMPAEPADTTYGVSSETRCGAILSWVSSSSLHRDLRAGDMISSLCLWREISFPHTPKPLEREDGPAHHFSFLVDQLRQTIAELDLNQESVGEIGFKVEELQLLLAPCLHRFKGELIAAGERPKQPPYELVDWQSINRDQVTGLPLGIRDEDGSTLTEVRISDFNVYLPEYDEDE